MGMIEWLQYFLEKDDTKIIYILALILIANTIDFMLGWTIAKLNPEVKFSSSKAVFGIARKITLYIMLVIFIPFSLLLPDMIGLSALYILYMGYLVTELFSILGHLGITTDTKDSIFVDFLNKMFNNNSKGEIK